MLRRLLACLVVVSTLNSHAQENTPRPFSINANYHYGAVLPEYSNLLLLVKENVQSFSLNTQWRTTGESDFEQLYNFPAYGLSFFYTTLGNDDAHGQEVAVVPYFRLNIIERRRFALFNETGVGLGYVTRKFDFDNNKLNVAVGSHLNIHFTMKLGASYMLHEKIRLQTGASFEHFSNANTFEPNLGLNFLTWFAGMAFSVTPETSFQKRALTPHNRRHEWEFVASIGGKHPKGPESALFWTSSITGEWKHHTFRALHFGIGADAFYDRSTLAEMEALSHTEPAEFQSIYNFRTGVHISQEFVYERLSLIIQEGLYVGLTDKVGRKTMYNRGIIRYRAFRNGFVQLAMKSHLHILDFPELGVGIKL